MSLKYTSVAFLAILSLSISCGDVVITSDGQSEGLADDVILASAETTEADAEGLKGEDDETQVDVQIESGDDSASDTSRPDPDGTQNGEASEESGQGIKSSGSTGDGSPDPVAPEVSDDDLLDGTEKVILAEESDEGSIDPVKCVGEGAPGVEGWGSGAASDFITGVPANLMHQDGESEGLFGRPHFDCAPSRGPILCAKPEHSFLTTVIQGGTEDFRLMVEGRFNVEDVFLIRKLDGTLLQKIPARNGHSMSTRDCQQTVFVSANFCDVIVPFAVGEGLNISVVDQNGHESSPIFFKDSVLDSQFLVDRGACRN